MNKAELNHTAIQRLIIIALGLLTFSVVLQSCQYHPSCAAYDNVETTIYQEVEAEEPVEYIIE